MSFIWRGVAREGNLGEMGEWMNYVKQWKSFCSSRFVSVSSPQHETGGYSPTQYREYLSKSAKYISPHIIYLSEQAIYILYL